MESRTDVVMVKWKTLSITSLLAVVPVYLAANTAYVNYHTKLAANVVTTVLAQHTKETEGRIVKAQKTAEETQAAVKELKKQVDSLQVSASIAAVAALQTELERHERSPEESLSWRRERDRLNRQVGQAKEYRQCLINNGHSNDNNCELLRGW